MTFYKRYQHIGTIAVTDHNINAHYFQISTPICLKEDIKSYCQQVIVSRKCYKYKLNAYSILSCFVCIYKPTAEKDTMNYCRSNVFTNSRNFLFIIGLICI
jgi:hypothetical protein